MCNGLATKIVVAGKRTSVECGRLAKTASRRRRKPGCQSIQASRRNPSASRMGARRLRGRRPPESPTRHPPNELHAENRPREGAARKPFDPRNFGRSRRRRDSRCRHSFPCSRARADPLRPNAGFAFYVLPRCSEPHGARSRVARREPASKLSFAATRTSPISVGSLLRPESLSSISTTSTRRFLGRSSGMSSGWPRASRSPAGTAASTTAFAGTPS